MHAGASRGGPAAALDPSEVLCATLVRQVASFLRMRGGRATSEQVMSEFNGRINAAQAAPFKAALRTAAMLEKEGTVSSWVLKAQYRSKTTAQ